MSYTLTPNAERLATELGYEMKVAVDRGTGTAGPPAYFPGEKAGVFGLCESPFFEKYAGPRLWGQGRYRLTEAGIAEAIRRGLNPDGWVGTDSGLRTAIEIPKEALYIFSGEEKTPEKREALRVALIRQLEGDLERLRGYLASTVDYTVDHEAERIENILDALKGGQPFYIGWVG